MTELPGGSTGCDVCGVLLDAALVSTHDAWHRLEQERFDQLMQAITALGGSERAQ
jgi:hypothetical protein